MKVRIFYFFRQTAQRLGDRGRTSSRATQRHQRLGVGVLFEVAADSVAFDMGILEEEASHAIHGSQARVDKGMVV